MNFRKIIVFSIFTATLLSTAVFGVQAKSDYGADQTNTVAGDLIQLRGSASETVRQITGEMVGRLLSFLGIVFLLLILIAGFMWMTAAGNDVKAQKAKKVMTTAVIGLIIISAAYAITAFIGDSLPQ